ncbi:hypothetical protein [Paenirhodobacter sp.]|uniref:hypothetical protein n=1 Tax=Paenirhodobacter sp. TaxID=1965326 RepID=UPI003B3DDF8A
MPAPGWDWTELQEQALRRQRELDARSLTAKEREALYEEEIDNLKERIRDLEAKLDTEPRLDDIGAKENGLSELTAAIGPEIYNGEFYDRFRVAASEALKNREP